VAYRTDQGRRRKESRRERRGVARRQCLGGGVISPKKQREKNQEKVSIPYQAMDEDSNKKGSGGINCPNPCRWNKKFRKKSSKRDCRRGMPSIPKRGRGPESWGGKKKLDSTGPIRTEPSPREIVRLQKKIVRLLVKHSHQCKGPYAHRGEKNEKCLHVG